MAEKNEQRLRKSIQWSPILKSLTVILVGLLILTTMVFLLWVMGA